MPRGLPGRLTGQGTVEEFATATGVMVLVALALPLEWPWGGSLY
jgi:hypothetical protein